MHPLPSRSQFRSNPTAELLFTQLEALEKEFAASSGLLYLAFPLYRDEERGLVRADSVLVSQQHGIVCFAFTSSKQSIGEDELRRCEEVAEQVPAFIHSRLIKNKVLRASPTTLIVPIRSIIYAPFLHNIPNTPAHHIARNQTELGRLLAMDEKAGLSETQLQDVVGTLEGAKGIVRPKQRSLPKSDDRSKGKQAEKLEEAICTFDQKQRQGMMGEITGPQRIRGLAGSGKTVVLAMKAALTHLQFPEAQIVYTFHTKSLYQHVKRLITRFYRQFDDRDPDWDRTLHILHGWGGSATPGVYSIACQQHDVKPMTFSEAGTATLGDRFEYACADLLKRTKIQPQFDYIFVDEGQDFPLPFIQLCHKLSRGGKFVLAYDELQTIFQQRAPDTEQIFGTDESGQPRADFHDDVVLHKCYRNPREVLVTAHALGFGIYSGNIVQMLESKAHWEDIGYKFKDGGFEAGRTVRLERPEENSLAIESPRDSFEDIVRSASHSDVQHEIESTIAGIQSDIKDGLRPDDILVITVDDRNAKFYLSEIEIGLARAKLPCNNLHADPFGIRDFSLDGRITLSTVHKAKGNEAYMVYVLGVDALMERSGVRTRNMLFTAVTRAKGWVRISGVGAPAVECKREIEKASQNFPDLVFKYPAPSAIKIMKRDLAEAADHRQKKRRILEQLQAELSDEEISELLREAKSGSRPRKGKGM